MGDRVFGAVAAVQLQLARLVVHRVGGDVHADGLLAQRVNEGVADPAHAGRLIGATREHDFDVSAVGSGRYRCASGDGQDARSEECSSAKPDPATTWPRTARSGARYAARKHSSI